MSQAQLAGPDLSDSYVSLIESGKRTPTPVVARLLAERLGCTTEFLLHGIEPRQRIDTELGLRHAELELQHGDAVLAADRFTEIVKASNEENALLTAHARFGRARALEAQGRLGQAVEAFERLRREAAAHPERLADLPLAVALSRCYQRAGDRLRARDLAAHALEQAERLAITQGEIAIELAAALVEARSGREGDSPELDYVRRVLDASGVPDIVDRSAEIHTLWQASTAAAGGEDSALAVRLADDAIMAGRPARLALQLA
ncbi:MAG TPA: helix-turn-helix transcriptional regulator, partial [Nonomuraea sp.]|nr:helix-turn-helix transcriptional regulator [Nonomuraea sp.]